MIDLPQGLYAGCFRHQLDAKRRLTIPAKWRFSGDENELYLALPDDVNGCITVYPPSKVAVMREKLSQVSLGDRRGQRALARLLGSAETFTIDKNGRINLSDTLYQRAGIEKACVLVGTLDKFSIWSPERHEGYLAEEDDGDLADILQSMGL